MIVQERNEIDKSTFEKTSNVRCKHIDIIKGFAMLSIIIMHCTSSFISRDIGAYIGYSWNVSVFFIIGGFFLNMEKLNSPISFFIGKLKGLYLPASIIYSVNVLLHNFYVSIGWYPLGVSHHPLVKPFEYYELNDIIIKIVQIFFVGGSGELAMGAMWFLYTMLYAFLGIILIYWMISKVLKNPEIKFHWMSVILFLIAVISCVLTNKYNITINRLNTAFTAMFLIWFGMIINRKWQWKYDQWWGFSFAVIAFVHCVLMRKGDMMLANNKYQDLVLLLVGSSSLIYVWGFIGKKIESSIVGNFFALMGKESLYLMAFHIIGFLFCNQILEMFDFFSLSDSKGLYTYNMGSNAYLLLVYVIFGIGTSFVIISTYRWIKKFIVNNVVLKIL